MDSNQLTNILQGQLSDQMIGQLSQQLGGVDKEKTATAASGIVTTLMGALARNASDPEGAQSLNQALEQDHDGSILDDVVGMVTGSTQPQNSRMVNGGGILKHVLGSKQSGAVDMISKMSGLDQNKTGSLMSMLAPLVMGALGKTKKEQGLDIGGLTQILTGAVSQQKGDNPTMDLALRFLDSDGDGSVMDDVANIGMKMLGGFFKK